MRGNEIELLAQIRQRRLCIDSSDHATNAEELSHPAEKRFVIGIEPQTFVAEQSAEIEKVSGAAAEIQDVEWPRAIKPEILYAFYVNANPVIGVLVSVDLSRVRSIRVMFTQPYQFRRIYRGENLLRTYWMRPTGSVLQQTFRCVAGKELLKFLGKPHRQTMQK